MRLSWREHRSLLLVPLGILIMYLALRIVLQDDDESSWNYYEEEEYEYYGL